jgi:TonB-dependent starch-binding outer membrane protein SusC
MHNLRLIFCLLATWLGLLQVINAQAQNQITGKVTSAAGEALPGVTVLLKGTSNGTATDASGVYN